jgi:DNA-directed RNA polymerase sigma subunit (sigma70/sigma32)
MPIRQQLVAKGVGNSEFVHYLRFAMKQKRLTLEQEKNLLARSRSGERYATEELVNANQFLVVAVSRTYADDRLGFMDRVAEGNVALIVACRRFQPGLYHSFRGYCLQKIREAIENALEEVASFRAVRPECDWPRCAAMNE